MSSHAFNFNHEFVSLLFYHVMVVKLGSPVNARSLGKARFVLNIASSSISLSEALLCMPPFHIAILI